nr:M28 family peptidase [Sporosarcina limicola]
MLFIMFFCIFMSGCDAEEEKAENQDLKETLENLTSKEMSGRLTGTKGNELAVDFVENSFKELGLETFQQDSFLIEYPHKFHDPNKLKFDINITLDDGKTIELERGKDFLESSGFTDYTIKSPYTLDINDSKLEEAFIVLEDDSDFQKAFEESKGVLIVKKELSRTLGMDNFDKPIIQITKETYNKLKKSKKGQIEIASSAQEETIQAYNVVGKIPGKDSKKAIVLSAHLDHVGQVNNTIYSGTIDNATGVSVLLNIARQLIDYQGSLENDIIIVAFNGEDSGLQGSYFFTDSIKGKYEHIYNINLDSLFDGPVDLVSTETEVSQELIQDLQVFLEDNGIKTNIDLSGTIMSDHSSFLHHHMNGLSIGSQNVMKKIHLPSDNTIKDINLSFLKNISDTLMKFVIKHDNNVYKHEHINEHEQYELTAEDEKLSEEFQEFQEFQEYFTKGLEELKYNEYKLAEYGEEKKLIIFEHLSYTFENLNEFKSYYPGVKFSPIIDNYSLKRIWTNKLNVDTSQFEVNKVYTKETSPKDLGFLGLKYYSEQDSEQVLEITISISKNLARDDDNSENIIKEIKINEQLFELNFKSESEPLRFFSYKQEVNNEFYTVTIAKGKEVVIEIDGASYAGIKSTLSEKEVENIIQNNNIVEIVAETLNSF